MPARTVRIISVVLAVILVLAAGAAVWLGLKTQDSDERQQERAAASSVASQFALRMDNVDGTDFDGYMKGINELLTTKAKTQNEQTFDAIKQSYQAAKVKGTGKVLLTADQAQAQSVDQSMDRAAVEAEEIAPPDAPQIEESTDETDVKPETDSKAE